MASAQHLAARKAYGGGTAKGKLVSGYLEQEVLQWSPEKLILKMYDLYIVACKKRDIAKMNRVLTTLMTSLNFEYQDQATRLYRLYEYCQKCVISKKYEESLQIIRELRDTWAQAFDLK